MTGLASPGFPTMTQEERLLLGTFIEKEFGIQMPPIKRSLLQSRLARRVQALGLADYREYFRFVLSDEGKDEFLLFTDLVTTHETSFFRESKHFQILTDEVLPDKFTAHSVPLRVLVAACASGEEAYTIAMVIHDFLSRRGVQKPEFEIEGLDISDQMVKLASRGVFVDSRLQKVPSSFKRQFLMRSKDPSKNIHRVVPELRRHLYFHQGNLMGDMQLSRSAYDLVFCRNVLIYFNRANQMSVVKRLMDHLLPGGYLFLGHSETMVGSLLGLNSVHHGVFRRAS